MSGKGFGNMMRQAQQLQKKMAAAQEEVEKEEVIGESGQGKVRVTITGGFEVKGVTIDQAIIDKDDPEILQDLVALAINDGLTKAKQVKEEVMKNATGGLNIPGLV